MTLASGTKLGPYEVISAAGAGGMGEVYRARDTRLDRTVAIKILPAHLSDNPEAKQRFDREARAISSLNHPNICTLYDVGHQDGVDYLVMEFLEGETLAARLAKGPLPPEQVLKYGIEICEGLEKAHRTGVIHRDLKPGNIMLTKAGAKLMDFGLAKAATGPPPASGLTATLDGAWAGGTDAGGGARGSQGPLTARGTIVGTFQYMSTEQIEGKEADARSDIFALGAVLYEMATGIRAFTGKTQASVIAAILAAEPQPISAVRPMSPPALDRVVKVCLAKDPDERFQSVHDLKLQLMWIVEGGSQAGVPAQVAARRKNRERGLIAAVVVCGLLAAGGIAGSVIFSKKAEGFRKVVRAQIGAPERYTFTSLSNSNHATISPDGSTIAFIAEGEGKQFLFVRPLQAAAAQSLAGTEGAYYPFWSPDSKFLGFFAGGKLKKVEASGGVVQTLCDSPFGRGGSWNRDGVILFTPGIHDVIYRVPDGGGQPVAVTKVKKPGVYAGGRWPYFLPDGKHFLYVGTEGDDFRGKLYAASLDSPEAKLIVDDNSAAAYASGYIFFVKDGNLVAQPFDPDRLSVSGNPVPVAPKVEYGEAKSQGNFSVSENGVLVYRSAYSIPSRLVWLDRSGKQVATLGEAGNYGLPRLSPDGRTVAIPREDTADAGKSDLWLLEVQRGIFSRLTFHPAVAYSAVWSPDGSRLAVAGLGTKVQIIPANGSGVPVTVSNEQVAAIRDWSPDGQVVIVQQQNSSTGMDVMSLSVGEKPQSLTPLLNSQFDEILPRLSPDGRWLAYISNESGRGEVYVVPFPSRGGRWQISNNGVTMGVPGIAWSRDGKQLYFRDAAGGLMAVDVEPQGSEFHSGAPRQIFMATGGVRPMDTAADGRILVALEAGQEIASPITLVLNWDAEMRK
jgi:Tol biopolymer transport system component/aminoglycoside phosphotransferase (APT) family kinase protein